MVKCTFVLSCQLHFSECRIPVEMAFCCFHSAILTAAMAMCELAVYGVVEHFAPHFFAESASSYNIIFFVIFSKLILLRSSMS